MQRNPLDRVLRAGNIARLAHALPMVLGLFRRAPRAPKSTAKQWHPERPLALRLQIAAWNKAVVERKCAKRPHLKGCQS